MTVHIAFSGNDGALILSDSQGSTSVSESHGNQKQFVGEGYIIGGAGHGGILHNLFQSISLAAVPEADIESFIEAYVDSQLRPGAIGQIGLLLLRTLPGQENKIADFSPETYRHFSAPSSFGSIGSGAHFVFGALKRHRELGVVMPRSTLADIFVQAIYYADAADESLTVDDCLMASFIKDDKTYLMGASDIGIWFAPTNASSNWNSISSHCDEVFAIAKTINSEIREATRKFSNIRSSSLDLATAAELVLANNSVETLRQQLSQKIADFCAWYDTNIR